MHAFYEPRVIMGVDPGTLRTGFGIVRYAHGNLVHIAHGTILLDKKKTIADRLADLARDIATLVGKYHPTHAAVEDVFLFKNPRSALVLGQARGAVLALLGMEHIPTETISPTRIKTLVAGRGQAQKFQIAQMVALELKINIPTSKDASDALAVAIAHAYSGAGEKLSHASSAKFNYEL